MHGIVVNGRTTRRRGGERKSERNEGLKEEESYDIMQASEQPLTKDDMGQAFRSIYTELCWLS